MCKEETQYGGMTEDKTNLILDCKCGCDDAISLRLI